MSQTKPFRAPGMRNDLAWEVNGSGRCSSVALCAECEGLVVIFYRGRKPSWPSGVVMQKQHRTGSLYDVEDDGEEYTFSANRKHVCAISTPLVPGDAK